MPETLPESGQELTTHPPAGRLAKDGGGQRTGSDPGARAPAPRVQLRATPSPPAPHGAAPATTASGSAHRASPRVQRRIPREAAKSPAEHDHHHGRPGQQAGGAAGLGELPLPGTHLQGVPPLHAVAPRPPPSPHAPPSPQRHPEQHDGLAHQDHDSVPRGLPPTPRSFPPADPAREQLQHPSPSRIQDDESPDDAAAHASSPAAAAAATDSAAAAAASPTATAAAFPATAADPSDQRGIPENDEFHPSHPPTQRVQAEAAAPVEHEGRFGLVGKSVPPRVQDNIRRSRHNGFEAS